MPRSSRSSPPGPEAAATGERANLWGAAPSSGAAVAARGDPENTADPRPDFEAADALLRISVFGGEDTLLHVNEFIRRYAKDRYRVIVADSVALAAFELLENGIIYGSILSPVVFELAEHSSQLLVRVSNHTIPARAKRLMDVVTALSRGAKAVYDEQLQQTVRTPTQGRLGLARVAYEGGMRVDARTMGNRVVVTAYRGLAARQERP